MKNIKNIYVAPTEKPILDGSVNYILKCINGFKLTKQYNIGDILDELNWDFDSKYWKPQNIYITNDEKPKDGEYCITKTNEVIRFKKSYTQGFLYKKIILTTDTELQKDGVQAIDDEFLEWFVQNPSCEEVAIEEKTIDEIELELNIHGHDQGLSEREFSEWLKDGGQLYRIVILKEEPKFENSIENTINIMSMANSMFGKKEEPKQDIIKTEEDAKIFVEALENIPEPNDKLKKAFRDFGKQETLEKVAEILKGKELFKESNDRARKVLSEIKSLPIVETSQEYDLLQHIKFCLDCNNESQAIRLIEKYGCEKQERSYSEDEVREIIKLSCAEGMLIQRTINDKVKIPYMRIKDFTIRMFEQFKKK